MRRLQKETEKYDSYIKNTSIKISNILSEKIWGEAQGGGDLRGEMWPLPRWAFHQCVCTKTQGGWNR